MKLEDGPESRIPLFITAIGGSAFQISSTKRMLTRAAMINNVMCAAFRMFHYFFYN